MHVSKKWQQYYYIALYISLNFSYANDIQKSPAIMILLRTEFLVSGLQSLNKGSTLDEGSMQSQTQFAKLLEEAKYIGSREGDVCA